MKTCRNVMFFLLCAIGVWVGKNYADPCELVYACNASAPCMGSFNGCTFKSGTRGGCYPNAGTICCIRTGGTPTQCFGTDKNGKGCYVDYPPCETITP